MRPDLSSIDPGPRCPGVVRMIVEIPKNSHSKYEYDRELGVFRLDRSLYSPVHYPGDYGFIPGTLAEDGDPADILSLVDDPAYPGVLVLVRPIGVLLMKDQGGRDGKILAVPDRDPRFDQVRTMDDIFAHIRSEIEYFFTIYKELEGESTEVQSWAGCARAQKGKHAVRRMLEDGTGC